MNEWIWVNVAALPPLMPVEKSQTKRRQNSEFIVCWIRNQA